MDVSEVAREVLALMQAEGMALSDDLTQLEQSVRQKVLEIGARAVELHLASRPLGYEGSSRPCDNPHCKHDQKFVGHRPRTLATLLGQVTFRRAYYHCKHCGCSCCPYDRSAGLGGGQESVGLAKAAALVCTLEPFVPAAQVLAELTGQRLGDRTIHRITRKAGRVASEQERQLALNMASGSAVPRLLEAAPRRLYVAVDGVMVHRDQWNEAKCVTCYWDEPDGKGGVTRQARYAVRFESAEQFKAFVGSLACRCGLESAKQVVLIGDGAAWIWEHVGGVLGGTSVCVTDWYHVMEHVWSAANALHGQGTPQAAQWAKSHETLLWEGKYQQVLQSLEEQRKQTRSPPRHRALKELETYLSNQGPRLAYDRFRAEGYDIGSGRVESACKHVVAARMKRSGMVWTDDGAQEMLSLRTAYLNGWWDQVWAEKPLAA